MAGETETLYGITVDGTYRGRSGLAADIFTGQGRHRRPDTAEIQRILHAALMSPDRRLSEFSPQGTPAIDTVAHYLSAAGIDLDWQSPGGARFFQFMTQRLARQPPLTRENYAEFFREFLDREFLPANGMPPPAPGQPALRPSGP